MKEYSKGLELIEDLFSKRWVPEIIHSIGIGNNNYKKSLDSISYISHTELSRKIKLLLDYGVIKRDDKDKAYKLTQFGFDVDHVFGHIYDISDKYLKRD
ncbi:winged helix-turn-helix transcriptional regulator [Anaerococcus sp. AGMB00486]|uniref:Winged helix-turn-helix transcriptional regulator n=1 Tax=Anaerococcus faecalis TaxID=2742993 RepID=A0ABX2N8P3_9FIRM|nr:winged helix-turn-helix transcriptional regulator [Anaerococcus faecalis]NVF10934.1 winged helix-turn-helix transcriptional regulator [Anaerococcus faecalis]